MEDINDRDTAYSYLSAAEQGNLTAQRDLCQLFFDVPELSDEMPDDFWERIERFADKGEDYANFIMHCRYILDPDNSEQSFLYIRKAIRHHTIPLAFVRLGFHFDIGLGTANNSVLADYYYEKAHSSGCEVALSYIEQGYEAGIKDIVRDIKRAFEDTEEISPDLMSRFTAQLERERKKKNYGTFSKLRDYLDKFYPDYDRERAIADILAGRDTIDADIFYSLGTTDNENEIDVEQQEKLLSQLYAPITEDEDILDEAQDIDNYRFLEPEENEINQCFPNLFTSYASVCKNHGIPMRELSVKDAIVSFPYMNAVLLATIRRQVIGCLLSIREVDPIVVDRYLEHLDKDAELLNIAEEAEDKDLQLFLISCVECHLDLDEIEKKRLVLLRAYYQGNLQPLADRLNEFTHRLISADIEHYLPEYTPKNLPFIDLE